MSNKKQLQNSPIKRTITKCANYRLVNVYNRIDHFYDEFLQTMECQELVAKPPKKVDLLLWKFI